MSTLEHTLGASTDGDEFEKKLYDSLIYGTKASNSFPADDDDLAYYENVPEFQEKVSEFKNRIVKLIVEMANNVDSNDDMFNLEMLRTADPSDQGTFGPLATVSELLLENVDCFLDESRKATQYAYASHHEATENQQIILTKRDIVRDVRAGLHGVITHAADIEKPQRHFKTVDNSRNPFKPLLIYKPHPTVPLPEGGLDLIMPSENGALEAHARNVGLDVERIQMPRYPNPYEAEIKSALASVPTWLFQHSDPIEPLLLDQIPCQWIDSKPALESLIEKLKLEKVIALDLENHSYRSFQGFLCLMQVSTRSEDFLVDALRLREHMHLLNVVFTDPTIVKVLHGADSDVKWLQRDFGVYLVCMFDTGQAARALHYSSAGLAHALSRHCNIRVNKAYQLADWRLRPLPEEMAKYAREDTHYLLYVFDKIREELLKKDGSDGVFKVLKRSSEIALNGYEKDIYTQFSYAGLVAKRGIALSTRQEEVLSAVYGWRDSVARREDESTQYVLPDRMLLCIAQDIPTSASDLEKCCNPLPPIVQTRVTELLALIRSAKDSHTSYTQGDEDIEMEIDGADDVDLAQSIQIGLNSSRSSFVPIDHSRPSSFVEAARVSNGEARRKNLLKDSLHVRATPSPVLTTDQLYDTAGWQEIVNPGWKAAVVSQVSKKVVVPKPMPNISKASSLVEATRAKIGAEQLRGMLQENHPVQESSDPPADAEALESEDIPRSLAEIYRISNRNRKRNKDKKKQKEDGSSLPGSRKNTWTEDDFESNDNESNKRMKDEESRSVGDDAIEFMRDLGWVNGTPVANLVIEGAPEQSAIECHESDGRSRTGSSTSRRGRKAPNASPRRTATRQPNARNTNQTKPFNYSQVAGSVRPPPGPTTVTKSSAPSSGPKTYRGKSSSASRSMSYRS